MPRKYKSADDLAAALLDSCDFACTTLDMQGSRQCDMLLADMGELASQYPVPEGKTAWVVGVDMYVKFVTDDEVKRIASEFAALERRSLMRALQHGPARERSQVVVEKPKKAAKKRVGKTSKKTVKKTTKKTKRIR
jgi:hypothetical protein